MENMSRDQAAAKVYREIRDWGEIHERAGRTRGTDESEPVEGRDLMVAAQRWRQTLLPHADAAEVDLLLEHAQAWMAAVERAAWCDRELTTEVNTAAPGDEAELTDSFDYFDAYQDLAGAVGRIISEAETLGHARGQAEVRRDLWERRLHHIAQVANGFLGLHPAAAQ